MPSLAWTTTCSLSPDWRGKSAFSKLRARVESVPGIVVLSSPPAATGRLVVWSTWRVRHAFEQVEHPQLLVISLSTSMGYSSLTDMVIL